MGKTGEKLDESQVGKESGDSSDRISEPDLGAAHTPWKELMKVLPVRIGLPAAVTLKGPYLKLIRELGQVTCVNHQLNCSSIKGPTPTVPNRARDVLLRCRCV